MKKLFSKLGIVLLVSSSTLPMVACTFNFYVNRATNSIAKNFANQTSALLKSMVMSKTIDVDTNQTVSDIIANNNNSSISNPSANQKINNWGDLAKDWGDNQKITTNGFNPDEFLVGTGQGKTTKQINSLKSLNSTLTSLGQIKILNLARNPMLYNLALGPNNLVKKPVVDFLTSLQKPDATGTTLLLQNLINNYQANFVNPLQQMFDNLIDGRWSSNQATTPSNFTDLKTFMEQWNDPQGQPYSNWAEGGTKKEWTINNDFAVGSITYQGLNLRKPETWTSQDFNIYRGGTLINYLFWKISNDYKISKPGTTYKEPRYLGDIISANLNGLDIDQAGLLKDLSQYLSHIIENPLYIILIIEGIIPLVKKYFMKMSDISQGVKHLTLGNGFPTDDNNNSYNLVDIMKTIKDIVNDNQKLHTLIEKLIGWSKDGNQIDDTFTYDLKLKILGFINIPLGAAMQGFSTDSFLIPDGPLISEETKNGLVDQVASFLKSDSVKNILTMALDVVSKTGSQYAGNTGIDINMTELQKFLFDPTIGIINLLLQDGPNSVIEPLKTMITVGHTITDGDLEKLYQGLGGNLPNDPNFNIFRPNSIIDLLQKNFNNLNSPITSILNLIFDSTDSSGTNKKGLTNFIIEDNNKWIDDNYTKYFDENNNTYGQTSNISISISTAIGIETVKLSYDFTYTIKGTTYHFKVKCIDREVLATFTGIRNFKFESITLIN